MITDLTKPIEKAYACPSCAKWNQPDDWLAQGIHFLADCECRECGTSYYHTLPLAHARDMPVSFSKEGRYTEYESGSAWLARPLIRSMTGAEYQSDLPVIIQSASPNERRDAILVNCTDNCFGHVFTKLCNLSVIRKKYPSAFLIAILPASMAWLLPPVSDEHWLIDGPLKEMSRKITGLNAFVHEQVQRFHHCHLHEVSIYADPVEVDFEEYLKVPSFDYSRRNALPRQLSFIWREDRFWHCHRWEELLYKVAVKMNWMSSWKNFFLKKQLKRIIRTAQRVREAYPDIRVAIAGLGRYGSFPNEFTDLRREKPALEDERLWLEVYAQSHVVIGVHGSNMIIPGIQAGAMIEIVPEFKVMHIGETTLKDYPSMKLCRHLTRFPSSARVAATIKETLNALSGSLKT